MLNILMRCTDVQDVMEGRFKSCVVDTQEYFLTCQRYIELNPVRAGMVDQPGGYRWSSFNAHAYNNHCALTTHSDLYLSLGRVTFRPSRSLSRVI